MHRGAASAGRAVGVVLTASLLALGAWLLLQRPVLGAAENLDFPRVMRPAGIAHSSDPASFHHEYVVRDFTLAPAKLAQRPSSAVLIPWLARGLGSAFGAPRGHMDLRQLGALYLAVAALFVVVALLRGVHPLLCALCTWVFVDPIRFLYLNSFFSDAAFVVGCFGVTLWLLRWGEPSRLLAGTRIRVAGRWSLLIFSLMLASASKQLCVYYGAVVAAVLVPLLWWPAVQLGGAGPAGGSAADPTRRRRALATVSLAVAVLLPVWHFSYGSGPRFVWPNAYHRLFHGLLLAVPDPAATAERFGVPVELRTLRGTSFFDDGWRELPGAEAELRRVYDQASLPRVAFGYLREPRAIAHALTALEPHLARRRPPDNSFERSDPRSPGRYVAPWAFSRLRSRLVELLWPAPALLVLAGMGIWLVRAATRPAGPSALQTAATALLAGFAIHTAAAVLGDGFFSLSRHLIGALLQLDLLIVCAAWGAARWAWRSPAAGAPDGS